MPQTVDALVPSAAASFREFSLIWLLVSLLAGVPVGGLGAWAVFGDPPDPARIQAGAALGALALTLATWIVSRRRDDDPARRWDLASAAATGFAAVPAVAVSMMRFPPGPPILFGIVVVLVVGALARSARAPGGTGGPMIVVRAIAVTLFASSAALVSVAAGVATLRPPDLRDDGSLATAVLDADARIPTLAALRCDNAPLATRLLLDRGARPRFGSGSDALFFDAEAADGRRQIYRLTRSREAIDCLTCAEPGENWRPAPDRSGAYLVFTSDRDRTAWDPTNTEIRLLSARGLPTGAASRRLTYSPGVDDFALLGPTGGLVWSRAHEGRFEVVSAPVRGAHGSVGLGEARVLESGGAEWVAPLDWSPDARSLVWVRGNPFHPWSGQSVDFGSDDRVTPIGNVTGGVTFRADGGFMVSAGSDRARIAGLLPASAGFLVGLHAGRAIRDAAVFDRTRVEFGSPRSERTILDLGVDSEWGAPTGIAVEPEGSTIVLGQRRLVAGAIEERLLEIELDCETGDSR